MYDLLRQKAAALWLHGLLAATTITLTCGRFKMDLRLQYFIPGFVYNMVSSTL